MKEIEITVKSHKEGIEIILPTEDSLVLEPDIAKHLADMILEKLAKRN
jgi:hypothetical protein